MQNIKLRVQELIFLYLYTLIRILVYPWSFEILNQVSTWVFVFSHQSYLELNDPSQTQT